MKIDDGEIDALLRQPSETRSVELKSIIDPRTPEGKAKLVASLIALRNFNGGMLAIGFEDRTFKPLAISNEILAEFHNDAIQGLVSKHASEAFDVEVRLAGHAGRTHPVIVVASGVRTPIAIKIPVIDNTGKPLLKKGAVLFRSLNANGIVSSCEAQPNDWPEITQICMDNREADIGRFIRRHLSGATLPEILQAIGLAETQTPAPSIEENTLKWLENGAKRASKAIADWPNRPYPGIRPDISNLRDTGAWEVALVIDPAVTDRVADETFYNTIASSNPSLSGWPILLGTRTHGTESSRHRHVDGAWEALIVSVNSGMWDHLEFQRWQPDGKFYLRRLYDDDASAAVRRATPGLLIDLGRNASRVAESIVTGIAIAKALGANEDKATLGFAYRWTGLRGRISSFWASQLNYFPDTRKATDDTATSFVSVPLSASPSAIAPFVETAVKSLNAKFDGFSMSRIAIENCVRLFLDKRT